MSNTLSDTLNELMRSATTVNPALNKLLDDYQTEHAVTAVVGSMFLVAVVAGSVVFSKRFARSPRTDGRRWTFEKKTYGSFGVLSVLVGLLLAVMVVANVSSARSPRQGFSGAIAMVGTADVGTDKAALDEAFTVWLQSASAETPALVQRKVDDRLAWQQPKAVVCSVLLAVFVALSILVWRSLLRRSREVRGAGRFPGAALRVTGVVSVVASLLVMLMVIGNTAASFAPLNLTMFFG
jgi:hypothetical protein